MPKKRAKRNQKSKKSKSSTKTTFGKLEPRYSFILNSYSEYRASKCPKCNLLTKQRKFVFLIFIMAKLTMNFGITSRFCSECELIILHQNDLESLLVGACEQSGLREIIGSPYIVIGTVDRNIWRRNLKNSISSSPQEILEHTSDFKEVLNFEYQPAGWYKSSE